MGNKVEIDLVAPLMPSQMNPLQQKNMLKKGADGR